MMMRLYLHENLLVEVVSYSAECSTFFGHFFLFLCRLFFCVFIFLMIQNLIAPSSVSPLFVFLIPLFFSLDIG